MDDVPGVILLICWSCCPSVLSKLNVNIFSLSPCVQYPGFCKDEKLTLTDAVGEEVEWEDDDMLPDEIVQQECSLC